MVDSALRERLSKLEKTVGTGRDDWPLVVVRQMDADGNLRRGFRAGFESGRWHVEHFDSDGPTCRSGQND